MDEYKNIQEPLSRNERLLKEMIDKMTGSIDGACQCGDLDPNDQSGYITPDDAKDIFDDAEDGEDDNH